jgi:hypothetical protein
MFAPSLDVGAIAKSGPTSGSPSTDTIQKKAAIPGSWMRQRVQK